MALANGRGSNEHPRKLGRAPLLAGPISRALEECRWGVPSSTSASCCSSSCQISKQRPPGIQKAIEKPTAGQGVELAWRHDHVTTTSGDHDQHSSSAPGRAVTKMRPARKGMGGKAGLPPAWAQGKPEAPAGGKDMGGWEASCYTEEQRARLGVEGEGSRAAKARGGGVRAPGPLALHGQGGRWSPVQAEVRRGAASVPPVFRCLL
jgi:hypothetical protein